MENTTQIIASFEDLSLKDTLMHGISAIGYHHPSPIQCRAIYPAIKGSDVIAQAQSGTGKTATFVISVLQRIDTNSPATCQAIVLCPTRELAQQIHQVFAQIGFKMGLKVHACIGGTDVHSDIQLLKDGIHVVVGTPGRISHMIKNNSISISNIKIFVLDEADEMLSRGFKIQIYEIFKTLPRDIQCMLYSATLPEEALEVTKRFMNNPVKVLMKREKLTLEGISQHYVLCQDDDAKVVSVIDLYGTISTSQVVIFVSKQSAADSLTNVLTREGFDVMCTHAGIKQTEREEIMTKFRENHCRILISTDLISRGIDVQNVSLVINFDMPKELETYLHRIGRGGRFGRIGKAINLVTVNEMPRINQIEEFFNTRITELNQADAENTK